MSDSEKVALITGANKGLGLEISRQLGRKGISVIIGSRDAVKGQAAAELLLGEGLKASAVKLDVCNDADIAALPGLIQASHGRLDILINNAGVSVERNTETNRDVFREIFDANVYGAWFVSQALLPLLTEAPAGRIVNQSSILGSMTLALKTDLRHAGVPVYSASKAALNMLTVQLANQLSETRVKVNAVHPGWVKTDMGGPNAPMGIVEGASTAVRLALIDDDGPTGGYFHLDQTLPW